MGAWRWTALAGALAAVLAAGCCPYEDADQTPEDAAPAAGAPDGTDAYAGPPADAPSRASVQRDDAYYRAAAARLEAMRARPRYEGRAKNIILFVGDGMGVATVTAARIFAGQLAGRDGESHTLAIDRFPHHALSRTYSHDYQVSDSAATATAMVSGVKTRSGVVGIRANARRNDCTAALAAPATTLFEMAEALGRATGVVSTARITHATPAAVYAHSANRDWENDVALGAAAADAGCVDIARQLVDWPAGDGLEIALGGGRANFLPNTAQDPEYPDITGARGDGRDLTADWAATSPKHVFVWDRAQLAALDMTTAPRVLGLFEPSHMQYEADRDNDPSLADLTRAAITRLSQHEEGYALLVEGGRIDHAHHAGQAGRALADTVAFDAAVEAALAMTSREDTLIIVTADHSHTLTIAGYPARNNPILGLAAGETGDAYRAGDGRPYTTLAYANGPGSVALGQDGVLQRPDLSEVDVTDKDHRQQSLVPAPSETHAGEDVSIYAWGPHAHLIAGTVEQHYIYHVLVFAAGL